MDSFELNKILGAILGTLLFVMGVGFLAEGIYHPIEHETAGYALPEPEPVAGSDAATTGSNQPSASIATLLAGANIEDGKASAKKCQSCHNFVKDGPNGQGPNLWGVVGRPIASHPGFNYSDAMLQHAKEAGSWTYDELNAFLPSPKARVPGTKMGFAGVKDDQERANIIAFLSTLSDNPVPFPAPDAAVAQPTAAKTDASQPTTTTTQAQTPVAGTPTGSNTPAGADTTGNAAPAATPATATTTAAPAATSATTTTTAAPAEIPAATTTTTTPAAVPATATTTAAPAPAAETPAATTTTTAAPAATETPVTTTTTTAPAATEAPAATTTTTATPAAETPATTTTTALKPAVPMTPPSTTSTAQ